MNRHENTQCDVCMKERFEGGRYKCLRCHDYDLCSTCFEANASSGNHAPSHPMQIICSISDMALYFGGEAIDGPETVSLTCSHCGKTGFTEAALMSHLISLHMTGAEIASPVLCPLCVRRPVGNPNYVTGNLPGHLAIEHQVPGPRSLISSLSELAITALRNPPGGSRPTPRSSSSTNSTINSHAHRNPMDAFFLELMTHLPDVRMTATVRERPESLLELQQFQTQMRQERQQARQQADYQRVARRAFSGEQLSPEEQVLLVAGPPPTVPRQTSSRVSFARSSSRSATSNAMEAALLAPMPPRSAGGFTLGHPLIRMSAMESLEDAAVVAAAANCAANIEPHNIAVQGCAGPSGSSSGGGGGSGGGGRSGRTAKIIAPQKPSDDNRYLLKSLFNPNLSESEAAVIDRERADRSLFVQSLLLSAMSKDQEMVEENLETPTLNMVDGIRLIRSQSIIDENKPKKKNKRRRKGAKKQTTHVGDDASQVSSQYSQEELQDDEA